MNKKIGIAAIIMMVSVFLSRVIGLLREMVIAGFGGTGGGVDAYQIAFIVPEILNHLLAGGFLSVTFIPIFSGYLSNAQEDKGWKIFSVILTVFGTLLLIFIGTSMFAAPQLTALLAPGIDDPVLKAAAVKMTRIVIPAQFFFFAGGLFMAVQFSKERFFLPALAPLIYNIGIICGGVFLYPFIGMEGFSWGALAGAFTGNFVLQLWGAKRAGMKFSPNFDLKNRDLIRYVLLTVPLIIGLTMTFSTEIFMKFFGTYLSSGSIAALNYGLRVMFVVVGVFGQALGVASFPFMARLAAENKISEMSDLLNDSLRYLALIIPFSILVMILSREITVILFQRGNFDAVATGITSEALMFLMIGTFAFAAQTVVVRAYYAVQDTIFPALSGTLAVILSIPLYIAGMNIMGIRGIALAVSISAFMQVMFLYIMWNRRTVNKGSYKVYAVYIRMIFIGFLTGVVLWFLKKNVLLPTMAADFTGNMITAFITAMAFIIILAGTGYVFKIKEITEIFRKVFKKICLRKVLRY